MHHAELLDGRKLSNWVYVKFMMPANACLSLPSAAGVMASCTTPELGVNGGILYAYVRTAQHL
jgi:hypothetical protein